MLKNELLSPYCFSESQGGVNRSKNHKCKEKQLAILYNYMHFQIIHTIICFNISHYKVFNSVIKPLKLLCSTAQNKNHYTTKLFHKQNGILTGIYKDLLITHVIILFIRQLWIQVTICKNTYNNFRIPIKIIPFNILKILPQEIQLQETIQKLFYWPHLRFLQVASVEVEAMSNLYPAE